MPNHEAALVAAARRVASCQTKRAVLRRQLKEVEGELKLAKKELRVLAAQAIPLASDQLPPLRMFGETAAKERA